MGCLHLHERLKHLVSQGWALRIVLDLEGIAGFKISKVEQASNTAGSVEKSITYWKLIHGRALLLPASSFSCLRSSGLSERWRFWKMATRSKRRGLSLGMRFCSVLL